MITQRDLHRLSAKRFPEQPIGIVHLLYSWTLDQPAAGLTALLAGTGLDPAGLARAVEPLLGPPDSADRDLL
ncbi:MAG: hypothetical protein GY770_28015 [Aestuariibacter sp.]|nr:hypothetical protein [Aestuariibacter sp.]